MALRPAVQPVALRQFLGTWSVRQGPALPPLHRTGMFA